MTPCRKAPLRGAMMTGLLCLTCLRAPALTVTAEVPIEYHLWFGEGADRAALSGVAGPASPGLFASPGGQALGFFILEGRPSRLQELDLAGITTLHVRPCGGSGCFALSFKPARPEIFLKLCDHCQTSYRNVKENVTYYIDRGYKGVQGKDGYSIVWTGPGGSGCHAAAYADGPVQQIGEPFLDMQGRLIIPSKGAYYRFNPPSTLAPADFGVVCPGSGFPFEKRCIEGHELQGEYLLNYYPLGKEMDLAVENVCEGRCQLSDGSYKNYRVVKNFAARIPTNTVVGSWQGGISGSAPPEFRLDSRKDFLSALEFNQQTDAGCHGYPERGSTCTFHYVIDGIPFDDTSCVPDYESALSLLPPLRPESLPPNYCEARWSSAQGMWEHISRSRLLNRTEGPLDGLIAEVTYTDGRKERVRLDPGILSWSNNGVPHWGGGPAVVGTPIAGGTKVEIQIAADGYDGHTLERLAEGSPSSLQVSGTVNDEAGRPIAGARVRTQPVGEAVTKVDGSYALALAAGGSGATVSLRVDAVLKKKTAAPRLTLEYRLSLDAPWTSFPAQAPPGALMDARFTVEPPGAWRLFALALSDGLEDLTRQEEPLRDDGTWYGSLSAPSAPGEYAYLVLLRDPAAGKTLLSRTASLRVGAAKALLRTGDVDLPTVPPTTATATTHRSWRSALSLRPSSWVDGLAARLLDSPEFARAAREASGPDRNYVNNAQTLPEEEAFVSLAEFPPLMSQYWTEADLFVKASTFNTFGDLVLSWRGKTFELTAGDAGGTLSGAGVRTVKADSVLNGVGYTLILFDFLGALTTAGNPTEVKEAWLEAGYAVTDNFVQGLITRAFGNLAGLPAAFVSVFLSESTGALLEGHKACWNQRFLEQAVAEGWLGLGPGDAAAVAKVKAAMFSAEGLSSRLAAWWGEEARNLDSRLGSRCAGWDLGEARGYAAEFIGQLLTSSMVEVNGTPYLPRWFYGHVAKLGAQERRAALARDLARGLNDLEALYLADLAKRRYRAAFQVVHADDSTRPMARAVVCPYAWNPDHGARTDEAGNVTLELDGLDFSPGGTILLAVRPEGGSAQAFLTDAAVFSPMEVRP